MAQGNWFVYKHMLFVRGKHSFANEVVRETPHRFYYREGTNAWISKQDRALIVSHVDETTARAIALAWGDTADRCRAIDLEHGQRRLSAQRSFEDEVKRLVGKE